MKTNALAYAKIANLCIQAFGELPESAEFAFAASGSLGDLDPAAECNAALVNGLLGRAPTCGGALSHAEAAGINVSFVREDFPCHPEHSASLRVTLRKGKKCYFFDAACTDGGEALIYIFDRVPVSFSGDRYEFLVFIETYAAEKKETLAAELREKVSAVAPASFTTNGTCWLIVIPCDAPVPQTLIDELNAVEYVQLALQLAPVRLDP